MINFSTKNVFYYHEKTIIVKNEPYQYAHIKKFFPDNLINEVHNNFIFSETINPSSDILFQKTKRGINDYSKFNNVIKSFIMLLSYSDTETAAIIPVWICLSIFIS